MAPPGVNSFYDHLDTIMTFGSCFSPFSSSYKSSLMSPSSLKQAALSPISSRSFSYGLSVIHADHDYFIKPAAERTLSVEDAVEITTSPKGSTSMCVEEEGSCSAPGSDAMLSSAADFENAEDNITDTDFLSDLDSIDFSLTYLDPCSDMAMEDSFQEFIDSALDKSSATFYGSDEDSGASDAVIYNKDDFFHLLGLRPNGQTTATPTSTTTQTLEAVPTKRSSCSGAETCTSIVYSTAYNHDQHTVQTSPSTQGARRNCTSSSQQVLLIPTLEFMTPLTIDTSFDINLEFQSEKSSPQAEDVAMVESNNETCDDSDTHEFLKWLHDDTHEPKTNDANNNEISPGGLLASMVTRNSQKTAESDLDLESFIDLDEYITDSTTTSYPGLAVTTSHSEEISGGVVAHQNSQAGVSDLKLSFLSELSYRFHKSEQFKNDEGFDFRIKPMQHYYSPQNSPMNSQSVSSQGCKTWPSSESGSPAHSPASLRSVDPPSVSHLEYHDATHLAMLDLFSEENAPALLHIEMSDQDIRFM